MISMTWIVPIVVFFTSIIGWQYFVGLRTVKPGQCYVQYMDDAIFNCLLQVSTVAFVISAFVLTATADVTVVARAGAPIV